MDGYMLHSPDHMSQRLSTVPGTLSKQMQQPSLLDRGISCEQTLL